MFALPADHQDGGARLPQDRSPADGPGHDPLEHQPHEVLVQQRGPRGHPPRLRELPPLQQRGGRGVPVRRAVRKVTSWSNQYISNPNNICSSYEKEMPDILSGTLRRRSRSWDCWRTRRATKRRWRWRSAQDRRRKPEERFRRMS